MSLTSESGIRWTDFKACDLSHLILQNGLQNVSIPGLPQGDRGALYNLLRALHEEMLLPQLVQQLTITQLSWTSWVSR